MSVINSNGCAFPLPPPLFFNLSFHPTDIPDDPLCKMSPPLVQNPTNCRKGQEGSVFPMHLLGTQPGASL